MGSRRTPRNRRPPGRPKKLLDDDTQETLLKALRLGTPVTVACQAADISESSFYGWMQRGRAEFEERAAAAEDVADAQPDPAEEPYLALFTLVKKAKADAAVRNVGLIQKVAQGGAITEESTRKYRDENGEMVEETTVKRTAPDWRASAWYLERAHRSEFAKGAEQVEITGSGGGPIEMSVNAEELSKRLSEHLAVGAAVTPAAITDGEDTEDIAG